MYVLLQHNILSISISISKSINLPPSLPPPKTIHTTTHLLLLLLLLLLSLSHIIYPKRALRQQQSVIIEGRLEHHVARQYRGGQHIRGRGGLDDLLPGVGGAGDDEAEGEKPF